MSVVKEVLRDLDELLLPAGFQRRRQTWNRRSGPLVDVIDVQVSKAGDAMTVNAGVLDPEIYRQCWGEEATGFVEEPGCTVRARLGELMDGRDTWWSVGSAEMVGEVARFAVPFLERMHAPEAMEEYLATSRGVRAKHPYPPPVIYLALLMHRRGDRAGACALLGELQDKALGAWQEGVCDVAGRIGCS